MAISVSFMAMRVPPLVARIFAPAATTLLVGVCIGTPATCAKTAWASELDLEPSLRAAALVMAARVGDVSEIRVVYGGKGSGTLYQYAFEPVRVLKGVYSRPQLLMTSTDLIGYGASFDPEDIRRGEQRLLVLGRSSVGYVAIHPGSTAERAFPSVDGPDDPLLTAVEALLAQQNEPDRLAIVTDLSARLAEAEGRGAVVLLAALERRSYIAAQQIPAYRAVARHLRSDSALVREAAADVLGSLLDADYLIHPAARAAAVADLVAALENDPGPLDARMAALGALGAAVDAVRANPDAVGLVSLDDSYGTFAELSGRLDVLGRLHEGQTGGAGSAVASLLAGLAFDAPYPLQQSATRAWARIAVSDAADLLLERIHRKSALGLDALAEIDAFAAIFPKLDDPWPLQQALLETGLTIAEQQAFVQACEQNPAPGLASALANMLDPRRARLRRLATDLLMEIDTKAAAESIRPHLAEELDLAHKLRLAAFLGRHGFDDGYPYALEHMSDPRYLEASVEAVGAIEQPGSEQQLLDIYRNSNDLAWKHAAVRALGLLDHEPFREELITLTRDESHPLVAPAVLARADMGDMELIDALPAALSSRSEAVAVAAARAAAELLPQQRRQGGRTTSVVPARLAAIARDPRAAHVLRRQALEALVAIGDPNLDEVLTAMIRDSRIEQSDLLVRIRELVREREVRL